MNNPTENVFEQGLMLLEELEAELRRLKLWSGPQGRPCTDAFLSTMPFFMDTMEFHEWLQYVLLPGLKGMFENGNLPRSMKIRPAAEEFYRGQWNEKRELIRLLGALDALCGTDVAR